MNRWNIPDWLESEVIARDRQCIYCRVSFGARSDLRRDRPSWEHIINDVGIITRDNIALCCVGCNASKGTKALAVWLQSEYCLGRSITRESIAPVAQAALGVDSRSGNGA